MLTSIERHLQVSRRGYRWVQTVLLPTGLLFFPKRRAEASSTCSCTYPSSKPCRFLTCKSRWSWWEAVGYRKGMRLHSSCQELARVISGCWHSSHAYDLELISSIVAPGNMFSSCRLHLQLRRSAKRRKEDMRIVRKRHIAGTKIRRTDNEMPGQPVRTTNG